MQKDLRYSLFIKKKSSFSKHPNLKLIGRIAKKLLCMPGKFPWKRSWHLLLFKELYHIGLMMNQLRFTPLSSLFFWEINDYPKCYPCCYPSLEAVVFYRAIWQNISNSWIRSRLFTIFSSWIFCIWAYLHMPETLTSLIFLHMKFHVSLVFRALRMTLSSSWRHSRKLFILLKFTA